MERDQVPKQQQENSSSLLSHQNPKEIILTDSQRNERLKRDEWSEGAVSSLLEAYEAKWTLRNRAKLKGQDWEDVAKLVSGRANSSKSAKTQTQCKNKIESMKKRYRSESAAADPSSWPLYHRLDLLLRGNGLPPPPPPNAGAGGSASNPPPVVMVELPSVPPPHPPPPPPPLEQGSVEQNSHGSNGGDRLAKQQQQEEEEDGDGIANNGAKLTNNIDDELGKNSVDDTTTESSTPAICTKKSNRNNIKTPLKSKQLGAEKNKDKAILKRGREEYWEVSESIRWLAQVVVRSEEARMETMREIERMRAEAEAKRGEMDLKRTEIIANTQLEIAKLFAKGSVDSSFKIGRS